MKRKSVCPIRRGPGRYLIALLVLFGLAMPLAAQRPRTAKPGQKSSSVRQRLPVAEPESGERFAAVEAVLTSAIREDQIPGAVILVGHDGRVVYRKAFGFRAIEPRREPMTVDTIFDVASLTKPLVTAMSVMRMVELGQVRLNDPVARYLPEFGKNGKDQITIRQLLTHFSGLREDLDLTQRWEGKQTTYRLADEEKPVSPPGSEFRYSDINYIVLGELVERISGMPLEKYADAHIFQLLGMTTTRFLPPASWVPRIAPTGYDEQNRMLRGSVHDPSTRRMGGVAGHAGVFSTADDLARFAQAVLDGRGPISTVGMQKMSTPQQPPTATVLRGLGWDIDSPFSSNRGELVPMGSFGHTGFTGTSMWIDPVTNTYIILLSNAVHPRLRPGGLVVSLRGKVATAAATALSLEVPLTEQRRLAAITGYNEAATGTRRMQSRNGQVKTGIDVLVERNFDLLQRKSGNGQASVSHERRRRIGLVTNQTGVDSLGRRTIDLLAQAPGIELAAIFSPEHGVTGTLDTTEIGHTRDQATGVPVYSVYGGTSAARRPSPEITKSLDAVVFDVQDAGVRFYTYETTLGYFLEAAASAGVEMVVLDRPNPLSGGPVQGPVSYVGHETFTNYWTLPVRHGMTMGELARMFNVERGIKATLTVIGLQGWQRGDWFDATGIPWVNPSPNLRSVNEATLYPGVALVEGTNVSVGRGTDTPFELVGAPWIDERQFARYLNERNLSGVRFVPVSFMPKASTHANALCKGVNIIVTDRNQLDSPELGIELASALRKLYPNDYKIQRMNELLVHDVTFESIQRGDDPRRIADEWRDELEIFAKKRAKYLLY